jgi:hypothetical protein
MRNAMKFSRFFLVAVVVLSSCTSTPRDERESRVDMPQVPTWSHADLEFFLHGSLGTEVIPEQVLRAFKATYPTLFRGGADTDFGLIPDPAAGLPVGFSRREVDHLAGLPSVGINCASCHVGEIQSRDGKRVRVLGVTSHFDVEAFFGAVIVATFQTAEPANMERFLANYRNFEPIAIARQHDAIVAAMSAEPPAQGLVDINPSDLQTADPATTARALLTLFHNMRFALHLPDQPPNEAPILSGPGRNDPWRILSYSLLGIQTKPAPVKFGLVWNEDQREWVHVDGNTRSPIVRNLAASLGLGAPLLGHTGVVDFAVVERQTRLSQSIRPPKYPWAIDRAAAQHGARTYSVLCANCHDGPQTDERLHPVTDVGTDPNRADIFAPTVAAQFNEFFTQLEIPGYTPPHQPLRSTGQYWSPDLAGVWARAPYLHNGSVRTMQELLTPPDDREKRWHRGTRLYDVESMGYANEGSYALDTNGPGSSNDGHDYGTQLTAAKKRDLIEYLKTK